MITIQIREAIADPSCLHISHFSGGFTFACSNETATDHELHWSEPTEWRTLPEVLTGFSVQKMPLTVAMAA